MPEMYKSFVKRNTGTQREDQQRDNESPKIQFSPMAQGILLICRTRSTPLPVQQQALIAGIDERMYTFAQHRGAAGPCGRDELRECNQQIASQRGVNSSVRRSG